jgi:hypothetical protein
VIYSVRGSSPSVWNDSSPFEARTTSSKLDIMC